MFTSGTTGRSKGVIKQNAADYFSARGLLEVVSATAGKSVESLSEDTFFSCLPLFHSNAQVLSGYPALVAGGRVAYTERFSSSRFWQQIIDAEATIFNSIGAVSYFIWNIPTSDLDRAHKVHTCFAAPAPRDIYNEFQERFGVKFIEGYGLTETGMATYMDPTKPGVPGSMGKANPGYEVTIVEPGTDRPLPPDTPGEIVVDMKIPNIVMRAYYGMPEKTAEDFRNLKLHTGDLGRMDEEGYFYFMDRVKDYIRRRGENVSSMEVERQVCDHPNIKEAAAIGVKAGEGASSEDEIMIVCIPEGDGPGPGRADPLDGRADPVLHGAALHPLRGHPAQDPDRARPEGEAARARASPPTRSIVRPPASRSSARAACQRSSATGRTCPGPGRPWGRSSPSSGVRGGRGRRPWPRRPSTRTPSRWPTRPASAALATGAPAPAHRHQRHPVGALRPAEAVGHPGARPRHPGRRAPLDIGGGPAALLDAFEIAAALSAADGQPALVVASDHLVSYEERVCDLLSAGGATAFLVGVGRLRPPGAERPRRARGLRRLAPGHRARGALPPRGALRRLRRHDPEALAALERDHRARHLRLRGGRRQPAPPADPARAGQGRAWRPSSSAQTSFVGEIGNLGAASVGRRPGARPRPGRAGPAPAGARLRRRRGDRAGHRGHVGVPATGHRRADPGRGDFDLCTYYRWTRGRQAEPH